VRVDSVKWCATDDSRSSSRSVAETESGAAIGAASSPGSGGAIGDDTPRNGSKAEGVEGNALSSGEGGAPEAATEGAAVDEAPSIGEVGAPEAATVGATVICEVGAPEAATVGATVEDDAPISVRGGSVVGSTVTEPGVGSMEASSGSTVASGVPGKKNGGVPGERNVASVDARVPVPLCFGLPPRMRSEMVACDPGCGYSRWDRAVSG
jgi:hypothetical protein